MRIRVPQISVGQTKALNLIDGPERARNSVGRRQRGVSARESTSRAEDLFGAQSRAHEEILRDAEKQAELAAAIAWEQDVRKRLMHN
jgi:hypothetical protein